MDEYITKKLPRRLNDRLRRLQAKYQLKHRRRVSEGRLVEMALDYAMKHERELFSEKKKGISKAFGAYSSKGKTNCTEEIDSVVYGG